MKCLLVVHAGVPASLVQKRHIQFKPRNRPLFRQRITQESLAREIDEPSLVPIHNTHTQTIMSEFQTELFSVVGRCVAAMALYDTDADNFIDRTEFEALWLHFSPTCGDFPNLVAYETASCLCRDYDDEDFDCCGTGIARAKYGADYINTMCEQLWEGVTSTDCINVVPIETFDGDDAVGADSNDDDTVNGWLIFILIAAALLVLCCLIAYYLISKRRNDQDESGIAVKESEDTAVDPGIPLFISQSEDTTDSCLKKLCAGTVSIQQILLDSSGTDNSLKMASGTIGHEVVLDSSSDDQPNIERILSNSSCESETWEPIVLHEESARKQQEETEREEEP